MRRASLQVLAGPDAGRRFDIEDRARVGARPLADIVLADARVSGLHCEFTVGGEALRVRDLGSKNGTFVGTVRILDALLAPGDVVTVGETRLQLTPAGSRAVPLHDADDFHGLVGQSSAIRALTARLAALAGADTTVLVQGETGTGKERVAEALHLAGRRAPKPLVVVDCGAMPATMIESELFGHERGAFTGAVASVPGAFERAHGGTLFLDEIGELPLELQPKLLRVLESRVVRRLGGAKTIPVDVRVVSATNRDLMLEVAAGRFREDLYYRLAVVTLDGAAAARAARGRAAARRALPRATSASSRRDCSPASRSRRSCATTGRATCASCATRSSAPSRCRSHSPSAERRRRHRRRRRARRRSISRSRCASGASGWSTPGSAPMSPACSTSAAATSPRRHAGPASSACRCTACCTASACAEGERIGCTGLH